MKIGHRHPGGKALVRLWDLIDTLPAATQTISSSGPAHRPDGMRLERGCHSWVLSRIFLWGNHSKCARDVWNILGLLGPRGYAYAIGHRAWDDNFVRRIQSGQTAYSNSTHGGIAFVVSSSSSMCSTVDKDLWNPRILKKVLSSPTTYVKDIVWPNGGYKTWPRIMFTEDDGGRWGPGIV